jgi:hypothetical protein
MCLDYSDDITTKLKKKFQKNPGKPLTFYKYYVKHFDTLSSYHRNSSITGFGLVISNRKSTKRYGEELDYDEVCRGIHVFSNRKDARYFVNRCYPKDRLSIVKVQAYEKDLVGAGVFTGKESAVFMKVEISKGTWQNLFSRKNKED